MRYENWDVLLFPEDSKVPIQEFKTQCFVIKDRGSPYLHNPALVNPTSYCLPQGNMGLLPVLTTFIPSVSPNTPFRVSVHSWERPRPSRLMESLLQPDDVLLFEVRIFIDGLFVSGSVFGQRTNWPHVIDIDKTGNQDNLRFPPFHREILEQQHWDAKVLEHSSIAWPNASMWSREPRLFKYNSRGELSDLKEQEETHAHSPARHGIRQPVATNNQISNPASHSAWTYRNYQGPILQMQGSFRESRWPQQEQLMPDPFIDPYVLNPSAHHRGARPSSEDVSMPDYVSNSTGSRAISHMTGISYEHSKHPSIISPIDEESYNQFFEVLSPPKPLSCGTKAPTNTPSATLPMDRKYSVAAEVGSASYINKGSHGSLPTDKSYLGTRDVSEASFKSNLPVEPVPDTAATSKLPIGPNVQVKSRKEGMLSDKKENEVIVETPRRESGKVHHTGSKTAVRTSGNLETPIGSRRRRSTGSARRESLSSSKKEPILLPLAQGLVETDGLLRQAGLEELLGPGGHHAGSVAEVTEID
ncbi:hypothetical protein BDV26DRAFT_304935 [Aspergillus bertholletiae]|uniref:Uncharacterized protein n=1 Tax=Aspergillus bertholletiae TaxID=1226010 RepID=A0A5N7B5R0_9EURO|nr:hypothetical protein BDV26DRAFT_304935 [Aspergillus bertholletiae]